MPQIEPGSTAVRLGREFHRKAHEIYAGETAETTPSFGRRSAVAGRVAFDDRDEVFLTILRRIIDTKAGPAKGR